LYGPGIIAIAPYYAGAPTTKVTIEYSMITDHSGGEGAIHVQAGASVQLNKGLFYDNSPADTNANGYQPGTISGQSTMLFGPPDFVSPGAPNYDYHIRGTSTARNEAVGSGIKVDVDDESRVLFAPADIGADEYLPIVASAAPTANRVLQVSWQPNSALASSTHHYQVVVTPEAGAAAPTQGTSINVGKATQVTLTGLTNYKHYTMVVQSRNASNEVLDSSNTVLAMPVDQFVYLPAIQR
jgi:hypothetical protein